jgi:PTS system mannose-specific IIB component
VISLVRVDNRLIHGQVVEAWLPLLRADRLVVADDEAYETPLVRAAMALAVPAHVAVRISPLLDLDYAALAEDASRTLLLIREVAGVLAARDRGLTLIHLNLGNVHFSPGRRKVSASVFLSPEELTQLKMLADQGVEVEARGVPTDARVDFATIVERFGKGA